MKLLQKKEPSCAAMFTAAALLAGLLAAPEASAQTPVVAPYCNDFEAGVDTGGGSFLAEQKPLINSGDIGNGIGPLGNNPIWGHRFGGYSDVWPVGGFTTSVDIYIPTTDHGIGVEQNRDYSVALNRAWYCVDEPGFRQRRDYVFNWGTSPTAPGKWVISASNNAIGVRPGSNPNPVLFDGGQWYQMVHVFSESPVPGPNGTKVIADMFFYERDTGVLVGQWQRSNDNDLVNTGTCSTEPSPSFPGDVGGNRYGLFVGSGNSRPGPWIFDVDNFCLRLAAPPVTPVAIDIQPGSPKNRVKLGSKGITKVAILGDVDFDATEVDPLTVELADATVRVKGNGQPKTKIRDTNRDGFLDLVLRMDTEGFSLTDGDVSATLTGTTFGGEAIEGEDMIRVVPNKNRR